MGRLTNGGELRAGDVIVRAAFDPMTLGMEIEMRNGPTPDDFRARSSVIGSIPGIGASKSWSLTGSRSEKGWLRVRYGAVPISAPVRAVCCWRAVRRRW